MTLEIPLIVFENDDFLVADKAPGISFHSESGEGFFASVDRLLAERALASGEPKVTIYPVHRLDKMTSGLVLLAKNKRAAQALGAAFESHQVIKFYLALAPGKPKKKQGAIVGDMEPARRGNWRLLAGRKNPAVSQFFSHSLSPGLRAYLIKPLTGKTHQIRVALKSLGVGIAGDSRYGKVSDDYDRGYLHAYSLAFELFGQNYCFKQLPSAGELFQLPEFQRLLSEDWAEPEQLSWPELKL